MGGSGALDWRIKSIGPPLPFVGVALTCDCGPSDNLALCAAVAQAQEGDVLVATVRSDARLRQDEAGTLLDESSYDLLIDGDATVYKPDGFNVGFNLEPALLSGKVDAVIGAYFNIEATSI